MTERIKGLTVLLDKEIRDGETQLFRIVEAIKMINGVSDVTNICADPGDWMARARVKAELRNKILDCFKENTGEK